MLLFHFEILKRANFSENEIVYNFPIKSLELTLGIVDWWSSFFLLFQACKKSHCMSWEEFEIKNHSTFSLSFQMLIHLFVLLIKGRGGGKESFVPNLELWKNISFFSFIFSQKLVSLESKQDRALIFFLVKKNLAKLQANQKISHLARAIKDGYWENIKIHCSRFCKMMM